MANRYCVNCGAQLDDGMKFCTSCGNPVEEVPAPDRWVPCMACGTMNEAGTLYCIHCGAPIDDRAVELEATRLGAVGPTYDESWNDIPEPAPMQQQPFHNPYDRPRRPSVVPYVCTAVAVTAAVMGGGIFLLRDRLFPQPSPQQSSVSTVEESQTGTGTTTETTEKSEESSVTTTDSSSSTSKSEEEEAIARAREEAKKKAEEEKKKAEEEKKKAEEAKKKAEEEKKKESKTDDVTIVVRGKDGQSKTETIHRDPATQRVFADSNTRELTESEVKALSDAERCIAWNEIICSTNGYVFKNGGLRDYFNNNCNSWYRPNKSADGAGKNLTSAANKNIALLKQYTSSWWKDLPAY